MGMMYSIRGKAFILRRDGRDVLLKITVSSRTEEIERILKRSTAHIQPEEIDGCPGYRLTEVDKA